MTGYCLMCGETGCNGCDIVERLRATPETGADPDMIFEAADEIERLRNAIERALADSESGNGWGPDVTACAYLREALSPNAKILIDEADCPICSNSGMASPTQRCICTY